MINGAVNVANRVQTDLNRILDQKFDAPCREPFLSICTTEGIHTSANPFESKIRPLRDKSPPTNDEVFVVNAACEVDFVFPACAFVQAEVVLFVLPEQEAADGGVLT